MASQALHSECQTFMALDVQACCVCEYVVHKGAIQQSTQYEGLSCLTIRVAYLWLAQAADKTAVCWSPLKSKMLRFQHMTLLYCLHVQQA